MMDKAEKLERLKKLCQAKGLRLTVQKRTVLENMVGRTDHPTADDVFQDVQKKLPGISRATVYRILDNLVQEGLIQKISHPDSAGHYDGNTDLHHHFLCTSCQRVFDIFLPAEHEPKLDSLADQGFLWEGYSINIQGVCPSCQMSRKN